MRLWLAAVLFISVVAFATSEKSLKRSKRNCGIQGCGVARRCRGRGCALARGARFSRRCGWGGCGGRARFGGHRDGGCGRGGCAPARHHVRAHPVRRTLPRRHETYRACGHNCEPSCAYNGRRQCSRQCVSGYYCDRGYVRDYNGGCVRRNQCPAAQTHNTRVAKPAPAKPSSQKKSTSQSTRTQPLCNLNEDYRTCGSFCEPSCPSKINAGRRCPNVCVRGCFCRNGYVRNAATGGCIRSSSCSRGDYDYYGDYGVEQPASEIRDPYEPTGSAFYYDVTSKECVRCGSNENIDCPRDKTVYGTEESCKVQGPKHGKV